jgi:hypothetical protein
VPNDPNVLEQILAFHTQYVVRMKIAAIAEDFPKSINPLKPELISICYLLALLGVHHFLHVSRIRVKLLTLR